MAHFHSAPVPCPPHPPSPHCPHPLPTPFSLTLSLCCLSPDPHFPCHQCPRRLYLPAPAYAALNLSYAVTVLGFRLNIDISCSAIYLSPSLPLPHGRETKIFVKEKNRGESQGFLTHFPPLPLYNKRA